MTSLFLNSFVSLHLTIHYYSPTNPSGHAFTSGYIARNKGFFFSACVVFLGSEHISSSALERSARQGEDDSVVVLAGLQPIRQAD